MNVKTITMTVAIVLLATTIMPVAAAHWRETTAPFSWTTPHEHSFALAGGVVLTAHSDNFQRMCGDRIETLTWGTQNGCPAAQGGVFPPVRGIGLGLTNCFDIDSLVDFGAGAVSAVPRLNGISTVIIDWGVTATPLAPTPTYNFADYFAHPALARTPGVNGDAANPTGATPAFLPTHVVTVLGAVQADITYTGLGWDGTGTGGSSFPRVDVGDNDAETCTGGASHTYAINSGDKLNALVAGVPTVVAGAGAGLNDLRNIGGDGAFDVTPLAGGASPVVGTGGSVPARAALMADTLPIGALLNIAESQGNKAIPYSVCNDIVGHGCTNIPETGSGARLGNGLEGDAVYSSLQDCVWHVSQTDRAHGTTGRPYSGVATLWGTATPHWAGDTTCWPERLVRWNPLPTSIYLPSSQTAAGWNPDKLPATYAAVEAYTIFVKEVLPTEPFDGFNSGCATGTPVDPTAACFSPTFAPPHTWFDLFGARPNTLTGFSAIFQP